MITSLQNEQVKHIVSLHTNKGRKEYQEYLIEGKRFVNEAFQRKAKIKKIYYSYPAKISEADIGIIKETTEIPELLHLAAKAEIPALEVSEAVMKKMTATEEPQGIIAVVGKTITKMEELLIDKDTILLILDSIQDPGNLGTILRTALAADVCQIVLTKGTVDLYNPKVLRSSMGAIFSQNIALDKTPNEVVNFCKDKKCSLTVCTMEGNSIFAENASDNYPLALVIGNEAFGPSSVFLQNAQKKYSLPMFNNVESLNAAMAAGIFLYELRRQLKFL